MVIRVVVERMPEIPSPDFYPKTAQVWHSWIIKKLRRGRSFYGEPFKPLSPITMMSRRGRKAVPLNDTGRLSQSIQVIPFTEGIIMRTNVIYAKTHQYGATIRPRNAKWLWIPINPIARYRGYVKGARFIKLTEVEIPARPFFPLLDRDLPKGLIKLWIKAL